MPLTRCLCLSTMGPPNLQFNRVFRRPRPLFFMVLGDGLDFFWDLCGLLLLLHITFQHLKGRLIFFLGGGVGKKRVVW